ncbi:MAG: ATP-binding protein [Candidatus Aureabacteria bacterium]|nr:ATP-binding protein [Candidatus Auribacterota bacterium]
MTFLPAWANQLQELFCSCSASQFILYGSVFDVVPYSDEKTGKTVFLPLKEFLDEIMLQNYDCVIHYDRGKGITASRGEKEWTGWLVSVTGDRSSDLVMQNARIPFYALQLIDGFILKTLHLQTIRGQEKGYAPYKLAVVIDFAQFVAPRGDSLQLSGDIASHVVKILSWANDPSIINSNIAIFLITEKLNDLNHLITDNPATARIELLLPQENEMEDYLRYLHGTSFPDLEKQSDMTLKEMAGKLRGLSRISAHHIIASVLKNRKRITVSFLMDLKKERIEKECQNLLEFFQTDFNLDYIAGHAPAKKWLRQDAALLRAGKTHALPMGYLITGRIGTGKTYLVECWSGELGIPCVVLKNFRDKWVGATESNLETIFSILRALGQVIVFIDEADQMTGKRESGTGDSGLSGRVYAMLAKEMSNTRNRGKIIWILATSRPDLLEVDLKRQGRLDVHIPLFPPQTTSEIRQLFISVSKKIQFPLGEKDLPSFPKGFLLSGNEIEGILIRALRIFELQGKPKSSLPVILRSVIKKMKLRVQTGKLEYMDWIAVKECTDALFLPPAYAKYSAEEVEKKIESLKKYV